MKNAIFTAEFYYSAIGLLYIDILIQSIDERKHICRFSFFFAIINTKRRLKHSR